MRLVKESAPNGFELVKWLREVAIIRHQPRLSLGLTCLLLARCRLIVYLGWHAPNTAHNQCRQSLASRGIIAAEGEPGFGIPAPHFFRSCCAGAIEEL